MSLNVSLLCLHTQVILMEKYSVSYSTELNPGEVCNKSR